MTLYIQIIITFMEEASYDRENDPLALNNLFISL